MTIRIPTLLAVASLLTTSLAAQTLAPHVGGHWSLSSGDSAPKEIEDLLAADLDHDGAPDVVVLGPGSHVFRNDRHGALVPGQILPASWLRRGVLVDVDGDGDLDLIASQGTTRPNASGMGPVAQLENRNGSFVDVTAQRMPAGQWLGGPVVALDFDRDGDLDLGVVVLGDPTSDLLLLDNNGLGSFTLTTATRLPAGLPRVTPTFLGAVDLDRDGNLDLVVGYLGGCLFLRNDGSGHFLDLSAALPATGGVFAVHDIDGDGDVDLLGASAFWLNNGNATAFTARPTGVTLANALVRIVDVDRDGRLDLVTSRWIDNLGVAMNDYLPHVWRGQANGTFTEAPPLLPADLRAEQVAMAQNQHWAGAAPVLVVDLDLDGWPDLVHGGWKAHVSGNSWTVGIPPRVLLNREGLELRDGSRRSIAMVDLETYGAFAGDLDGDGHVDLVLGQANGDRVLTGRGDGSFALGPVLPGTGASRSGLLVDLDGDGDLDFVRSGFSPEFWPGAPPSLLLHQGGTWVPTALPPILDPGVAFAAGDVDGDGDVDLVVGCLVGWPSGGRNQLLLNDGTGHFTDGGGGRLPPERQDTTVVLLRDVDGDGDLDLIELARYIPSDRLRLSLNDGTGHFTEVSSTHLPAMPPPSGLAAVDLDRDGDIDLVTPGTTLRNDGTGHFTAVGNGFGLFQHLVDLDGSGTWTTILPEQGLLNIQGQRLLWNWDSLNVAVPADVDGDGDLDVVVAGWLGLQRYNFNAAAGVLFNLHHQLHAPRLLRLGQPWPLQLQATTPGCLAVTLLGAGLSPRPVVAPFGRLGVDPSTALLLPAVVAGTAPAPATLDLQVPADPSLLGVALQAQALVVPPAGLLAARLTGVASDRITR